MALNTSTTNGGTALMASNTPPGAGSLAQPGGQYFNNAPGTVSFPVTLPSIPNPTPPPPQKVAVVNPSLAQKDLTQKQGVSTGTSAALAQQTQNNLAVGQQPPQQAVQQTTDGQQQTNGQQQQTQQSGQQKTNTQTGTQQGTETNPNLAQVTLPGGIQANYDSATGAMTTADGKQLAWNQAQNAWIDPNTGVAPIQGGGSAVTGVPSTGDPTTDYLLSQYQTNQAQADANSAQFQTALGKILNGAFPLTADQQAQVSSLQSQYDQLKTAQQEANDQYVTASKLLGIRSGRQQYQPGEYNIDIHEAISDGISKIAALDSKAAGAVSTLKQGFMDDDYKIINSSYAALQDAITQKTNTLDKMQATIKNQVDLATSKLNQQKTALDVQTTQINNLAQSALQASLKLDGTLDLDQIQQIADENGLDANALYGAVQKAQQDEVLFQQGESKFASDQLQAAAQLKATGASTEASLASASSSRATAAKTAAETSALNGTAGITTALSSQPGYKALTAKQKTQADASNNIVQALKTYRTQYDSLVDETGANVLGADAATLESAYNALIFQVAQAVGTGALQQADREVIEKILPNPTTLSGAFGSATKGGKTGGLGKIDGQITQFTNQLSNYGLKPTEIPQDTTPPAVGAGGVVEVNNKKYTVDANGDLTEVAPKIGPYGIPL